MGVFEIVCSLCRGSAKGFFDVVGVSAELCAFALRVPLGDVGDATPCRDAGPDFRSAACHQQGGMATAGNADAIDPAWVDWCVGLCIIDCREDVTYHEVGAHSRGSPVRSPEVGVDEGPACLDTPFCILGFPASLLIAAGPGVERDEEGDRFGYLGRVKESGLLGIVRFGGVADVPNFLGIAFRGLGVS